MTFPVAETAPGVTRQVPSDHPDLMVVAFRFASGGACALHRHPRVRATCVQSGRFRFAFGDDIREVGPGDRFVIPTVLPHACTCLGGGVLIDSFSPRRDDFL